MIKVPLSWQLWLGTQPEYAMGYQYASVRLSTGGAIDGYILNGASFATRDELSTLAPKDLAKAEAAAAMSKLTISDIALVPRPKATMRRVIRINGLLMSDAQKTATFTVSANALSASQGAKDSPLTATKAGELFKRFSAYENDFRITDKRGLKPGTYATTEEDATHVHTGMEAVSRYALENKQSANKRFTIAPLASTRLQEGIVQPAYNEPGGGVEVIFVDGTADGTVSLPDFLPE